MDRVTVGFIGAGYIGKEHARAFRLVQPLFADKLHLVGVADVRDATAKAMAKEFQIEYATTDVDALVRDPKINTIVIGVPTVYHESIIEKAIAAGKVIFCEKPFAISHAKAKKIHDLLINADVPHQVGFVLRYAPTYHALKVLLASCAEQSPLRHVILRDDQIFPIQGLSHFTDWRSNQALAGAGVLIEHGIHDVDIIEWLFGKITRVQARMSNHAGYPGVEDFIEVQYETDQGVSGTMTHIWHEIPAHQSIRHFEIFFQKALVRLETYDLDHIAVRDESACHRYERPDLFAMVKDTPLFAPLAHREDIVFRSDYYACQAYWFVRNLLEGKSLSPTIIDGLRAFSIADACYRSAKNENKWVVV